MYFELNKLNFPQQFFWGALLFRRVDIYSSLILVPLWLWKRIRSEWKSCVDSDYENWSLNVAVVGQYCPRVGCKMITQRNIILCNYCNCTNRCDFTGWTNSTSEAVTASLCNFVHLRLKCAPDNVMLYLIF